jgi:hypothetical protein
MSEKRDYATQLASTVTHSGIPEKSEAEAKVGAVDGGDERLGEDVDDNVGVRELGVELVAAALEEENNRLGKESCNVDDLV